MNMLLQISHLRFPKGLSRGGMRPKRGMGRSKKAVSFLLYGEYPKEQWFKIPSYHTKDVILEKLQPRIKRTVSYFFPRAPKYSGGAKGGEGGQAGQPKIYLFIYYCYSCYYSYCYYYYYVFCCCNCYWCWCW